MTVIIISKQERNEYETDRLVTSFNSRNITTRVCHPDNFDIVISSDITKTVLYNGEALEVPKLVLVRLGAGILPFQLAVVRQFEQMGVQSVNASEAINVVRDKLRTGQILASHNIPIPKTMMVRYPIDTGLVEREIGRAHV